jgi:TonB family protein
MGIPEQIRKLATRTVRPVYPEEAIRAGTTGLVVAEICVPLDGRPASIKISSAPSEALARAAKTAISQWRFRTRVHENEPLAFGGKIIFYFLKQDDKWKALDPMESFYVGPRFALKQQHPLPKSELFLWPEGAFVVRPTTRKEE